MNRYEALKHAVKAHAGQVDKCGKPYILHPIAVADAVERTNPPDADIENDIVIALLHDVWEDTDYGLPISETEHLFLPLAALTHMPDESYTDYIERIIVAGEIASTVKLADIWHNLQPERLACLPSAESYSLSRRYFKARDRIWEALGHEWWPEGGER